MKRLLITGAGGTVGRVLRSGLRTTAERVRLLDLTPLEPEVPSEECVTADLGDLDATLEAFRDVDAVIHLAANPGEAPFEEMIRSNLRPTYHVYEAARRMGTSRVVFASSHHAVGFYPRGTPLDAGSPHRPDSLYGVSKCMGEDLGRLYADKFGLQVVCVRIGSLIERPTDRRHLSTWLSHGDAVQLFARSLLAEVDFEVLYGISANTRSWWDRTAAARMGYHPGDDAEHYAREIEATPEDDPTSIAARVQGGPFASPDTSLFE